MAEKNQRWLDAARQLSPRVTRDLLDWSTKQEQSWTAEADLNAESRVSWASNDPVPAWLDPAREQIRLATGHTTSTARLAVVLRTFVWALPHQSIG